MEPEQGLRPVHLATQGQPCHRWHASMWTRHTYRTLKVIGCRDRADDPCVWLSRENTGDESGALPAAYHYQGMWCSDPHQSC